MRNFTFKSQRRAALFATVAAAAVLGVAPVAHADAISFSGPNATVTDGSLVTGPAGAPVGGVTSSTSADGTSPTLSTVACAGGGAAPGTDYVPLATPITSNSGIWTLPATVSTNV